LEWNGVIARINDDISSRFNQESHSVNQIFVPASPGELLDKISILRIKAKNINDSHRVANVLYELHLLEGTKGRYVPTDATIDNLYNKLAEVNTELWNVEDSIRELERELDFGEKFVSLARSVYKLNDERSKIKREINIYLSSTLVEEKSY
jgi:hypothetical protein